MSALWRIVPRDPLVAGDGRGQPALASRLPNPVPPQPTVAGFARTLVTGGGRVSLDEAEAALRDVSLRGPLVATWSAGARTLWVPAPADAARAGADAPLVRAEPLALLPGEGLSWDGEAPPYFLRLPSKDADGAKLKSPVRPAGWPAAAPALWPWKAALAWALGQDDQAGAALKAASPEPPMLPESRVHVALNFETGTAAAGMLFSSAGWRYAEGAGLLVEVEGAGAAPLTGLLGAESRISRVLPESEPLPAFPEGEYRAAWDRLEALAPGRLALRVQLLTPGCFGDWCPSPPAGLPLLAAALGAHGAVSGWNLQARAPRPVRRLVPPGAVYLFGPLADREAFLACAQVLWLRPVNLGDEHPDQLLAAPGRDGFGLALPGLTALPGDPHAC